MVGSEAPDVDIHAGVMIDNVIAMVVLTTALVGLRFYVRICMVKSFGYDDWCLLAAYVNFTVLSGLTLAYASVVKANGLEASLDEATVILMFRSFFYSVDIALVKVALAAFFYKVLPGYTWQRCTVVISTGLFCLYTFTFGFVLLFQCGDPTVIPLSDNCLPGNRLLGGTWTQSALNASVDWLLTLIPVIIVLRSQMPTREKRTVIPILGLGVLASIISVVRMPLLHTSNVEGYESYVRVTPYLLCSNWENCIGLMAISLAALRPLLRRLTKGSPVTPSSHFPGRFSPLAPVVLMGEPKNQKEVEARYEVYATRSLEDMDMMRHSGSDDTVAASERMNREKA